MNDLRTKQGVAVHAYEHVDTRRYIYLDDGGEPQAWNHLDDDTLEAADLAYAMCLVFATWPAPAGWEPELRPLVDAAIDRARAAAGHRRPRARPR